MALPEQGSTSETAEQRSRNGILSALIAYVAWGVFPLFFVLVKEVPALEVLVHRVIWAVPFGAVIIMKRRQWPEVLEALKAPRMLLNLLLSAIFIAANWLVYIWAVQNEQINQASLGYYINPLLFAVAGVIFFGEKLRKQQVFAVGLAAIGVSILTFSRGTIPYVALFLGVSFTLYGLIRKHVVIGGMPGLFVETMLLLPLAIGYLFWIMWQGTAVFTVTSFDQTDMLLFLAGPLTVIPLLFFALAARRLSLSALGMMQFIAPTLQFLVALSQGEKMTSAHVICFACIWSAVLLFCLDAWRVRAPPAREPSGMND